MTTYSVVIIGSGFGGQCAAINLIKNNITDFVILERRDFMGGTWCQNSYPGAAVDVQSLLYSISHEPYQWSQMYAGQAELEQYTEHVLKKYKLREKTIVNTNVEAVTWDEPTQTWLISTGQVTYHAKAVINASGPLSTPVIPNFKGVETFQGKSFHTNNWDHTFDYSGKRVAIIGSGASAAQIIPAIAGDVAQLHVFQRSPHWVLPRHDKQFSPFQQKLLGFKPIYSALRNAIYLSLETRVIGFKYSKTALNLVAQKQALRHINQQIKDPVLRAKVTPDYTIGCKRIILSSTLYPALARDNVALYTKTQGIQEITPTGIITQDGQHLDLDLIIYSTGYDATDGVISYPVTGRHGHTLKDFWHDYPRAYLGTTIPHCPNLFVVTGPNTGIGHTSAIFVIEAQMNYIMDCLKQLKQRQVGTIEVTPKAENEYTTLIHSEMNKTVWKTGGCNSWYQSKSGHVIAMFPGFSFSYWLMARKVKPEDHLFDGKPVNKAV